jgi:hypothetical protein
MWQDTQPYQHRAFATVLDDKVFVLPTCTCMLDSDTIFNYSRFSGKWRKYSISGTEFPILTNAVCVTIGKEFFAFGGLKDINIYNRINALWKLTYDDDGRFVWRDLTVRTRSLSPAPREFPAIWEDGRDVWIYGGRIYSYTLPNGYLNTHEEYQAVDAYHFSSNGLFQYDVRGGVWINHENKGAVPPASDEYIATRLRENAWMYGPVAKALFQLNLRSMHWTQVNITAGLELVEDRSTLLNCSFFPIDIDKIVLCGGFDTSDTSDTQDTIQDICILDISTRSWSRHTSIIECHMPVGVRYPDTKTFLVIGDNERNNSSNVATEFHIEPQPRVKPLLWYALRAVDQHRERMDLRKGQLPDHLRDMLLLPGEK